jgi:predicted nucleotidyltransferase
MEPEKQIADFVARFQQAAGGNLECIALFGSAASGEFHADYSDINMLCIVREISPPILAALAPVIQAWTRKRFPAPLIFSRMEFESSADVFPIEMFDLSQRHRVLYGQDIFKGMKVPMERHRIQLEHNLRTKLLTLRQSYMQAVGDDRRIRRLMLDSVSTFSTLFRHTLIAMGEPPAPHNADNIRKLAERIKFDPGIYLQLLQVRERKAKENQIDVAAGFARYMDGINAAVEAVDAL